jgi:hypothetical protein
LVSLLTHLQDNAQQELLKDNIILLIPDPYQYLFLPTGTPSLAHLQDIAQQELLKDNNILLIPDLHQYFFMLDAITCPFARHCPTGTQRQHPIDSRSTPVPLHT